MEYSDVDRIENVVDSSFTLVLQSLVFQILDAFAFLFLLYFVTYFIWFVCIFIERFTPNSYLAYVYSWFVCVAGNDQHP